MRDCIRWSQHGGGGVRNHCPREMAVEEPKTKVGNSPRVKDECLAKDGTQDHRDAGCPEGRHMVPSRGLSLWYWSSLQQTCQISRVAVGNMATSVVPYAPAVGGKAYSAVLW